MVENTFTFKRDSVGLSCAYCIHCENPEKWPDTNRILRCKKHNVKLSIMLNGNGYLDGAYICKDYVDNSEGLGLSWDHFRNNIHDKLSENILYEIVEFEEYLIYKATN